MILLLIVKNMHDDLLVCIILISDNSVLFGGQLYIYVTCHIFDIAKPKIHASLL